MADAHAAGIPVLDELEVGWRLDARPVVAITGTNGKSTVAGLAVAVLAADGRRPALAGNTHFGPPLSALPLQDGDTVVAECSSFQLEHCPAFAPDAAALTNLTDDHLWHHDDRAAYAAAKRSLFLRGSTAVPAAAVGIGEPFGRALAADLRAAGSHVVTAGDGGDLRLAGAVTGWDGTDLVAEGPSGRVELHVAAVGRHMACNALTALALADVLGIARADAIAAIAACPPVPGRFQRIDAGGPAAVVVDFAHNPAGVRAALATAVELAGARSRVRALVCAPHVYPAPELDAMGRAAGRGAGAVVVAPERWSPSEPLAPPPALVRGVAAALGREPVVCEDRGEAIAGIVAAAHDGDVVVIMGRGERRSLLTATGERIECSDAEFVRAALHR